jgi:GNAT superfamily N-acetyltransferase
MFSYHILENIIIKEINPNRATDEEWKKQLSFRKERHKEVSPEEPALPDELYKKQLQIQYNQPDMNITMHVIQDNKSDTIIGNIFIAKFSKAHSAYEENKFVGLFSIELLPEYRRKGIGKRILHKIYDFAIEHNLKVIISGTEEKDGKVFLEHIGAKLALISAVNRVNLEEINLEMLKEWTISGQSHSLATRLLFFERIPDELIENFADTSTEVLHQVPLDNLDITMEKVTPEKLRKEERDRLELGTKAFFFISLEDNNEISGLTTVTYNPNKPGYASQGLTGVKNKYRGRGLGKWLKAAMLLYLRANYTEIKYITTGNANSNAPMLAINKKIGFKIHKELINAQITIEELKKYLNR